jgi:uncharacterized membrane protein YeaQ/YmgE (transglycosylase-associated protein family)
MSVLAWLVLGLLAGFIANRLVSGSGGGVVIDMILGVVGAFVGGAVFHYFGHVGITGFNPWSILVSVIGAVLVLVVYRAASGSSSAKSRN